MMLAMTWGDGPMVQRSLVGAISMFFGCGLVVPHGGVFVLAIANGLSSLGW